MTDRTADRLALTLAALAAAAWASALAAAGLSAHADRLAAAGLLLAAAAAAAFTSGAAADAVRRARAARARALHGLSSPSLWTDDAELDDFLRDTYAARGALTLAAYQTGARVTARYPKRGLVGLYYTALGLAGEAGEIANKVKKLIRDEGEALPDDARAAIADELGDALWYAAMLARELDLPLEDVARRNLAKLRDRAERGAIAGSGDHR